MKKTAIDLFCGAGGLSVGLQQAGFDVVAGVEINPLAVETYRMNHGDHVVYDSDIKTLNPEDIMEKLGLVAGELDLLAGCPPCQGFSTHRTRNRTSSVDDERNDLVFEYLRFVEAMRPKTVMMENVPGLAKDVRIEQVKAKLSELGYQVNENTVLVKNAADYGVPQRRRRMILLASRFGFIEHPPVVEVRRTVSDAIGHMCLPGESSDVLHNSSSDRTERIKKLISLIPKNGGSRKDLPKEYWLPCHIRSPNSYHDVYGRMAWEDVSPTITSGCVNPSKGRFLHPEENRAITLREAALLQSFPDDYKFSLANGKYAVALMIGNALPPEFIRRHAEEIYNHLRYVEGRYV